MKKIETINTMIMILKNQKLDSHVKYSILSATVFFSLYLVIALNALIAIIYISELIKEPDYERISLSIKDGYYAINERKMGVSLFQNFLCIILIWFLMINHALKTLGRTFQCLFDSFFWVLIFITF